MWAIRWWRPEWCQWMRLWVEKVLDKRLGFWSVFVLPLESDKRCQAHPAHFSLQSPEQKPKPKPIQKKGLSFLLFVRSLFSLQTKRKVLSLFTLKKKDINTMLLLLLYSVSPSWYQPTSHPQTALFYWLRWISSHSLKSQSQSQCWALNDLRFFLTINTLLFVGGSGWGKGRVSPM